MRKVIVILFACALLMALVSTAGAQEQQGEGEKRLYHTVEYTDVPDDQAALPNGGSHSTTLDPGQVILTVVSDNVGPPNPKDGAFDYGDVEDIDALANHADAYFLWLVRNGARLLVSFEYDHTDDDGGSNEKVAVWWETTGIQSDPLKQERMWYHSHLSN